MPVPSLRGAYTASADGSVVVWEGKWAMNVSDFEQNGYLSPFRYERTKVTGAVHDPPLPNGIRDGLFSGYFMLGSPTGPTKW